MAAAARATVADERRFEELTSTLTRYLPARRSAAAAVDDRERIWTFNDDGATTDQDVYDVIDKALADLGGLG